MTRVLAVLFGSLLLAGAAPRASLPLPSPLPLPLPPPLPSNPPTDLAAPMPDDGSDGAAGSVQDPRSSWALRIYRMQEFGAGGGYIPGSAYQSPEERRPLQTPGFMFTVPLQ